MKHHWRLLIAVVGIVSAVGVFGYWWYGTQHAAIPVVVQADQTNVDAVQPKNFTVSPINGTSATVEWETSAATEGFILIGESAKSLITKFSDTNAVITTDHRIRLFDLQPGRKYYYVVVSNGLQFGRRGEPLELVTTQ